MIKTKHILLAVAAMTFATSCSNDTEPAGSESGTPCALRVTAGINGAKTRASGTNWDRGDCIGIYCFGAGEDQSDEAPAYTNMQYCTEDGSGIFSHVGGDDTGVFIKDPAGYNVFAVYPFDGFEGDNSTIKNISTANQDRQKDFDILWASGYVSGTYPEVLFDFEHQMARLVLTFRSQSSRITVDDLRSATYAIDNVAVDAELDVKTGSITPVWEDYRTLDVNKATQTLDGNRIIYDLILPPGAFDKGAVLRVVINGITYKLDLGLSLKKGTKSTMLIDMDSSGKTLKVNCTIEPWEGSTHDGDAFESH